MQNFENFIAKLYYLKYFNAMTEHEQEKNDSFFLQYMHSSTVYPAILAKGLETIHLL